MALNLMVVLLAGVSVQMLKSPTMNGGNLHSHDVKELQEVRKVTKKLVDSQTTRLFFWNNKRRLCVTVRIGWIKIACRRKIVLFGTKTSFV